jgi:eukaryotic-like serine/threonine-protein kinase
MINRTISHYRIVEEISRGGMGIVYRAVDVALSREVAVNVLPPDLVTDPASALEHPRASGWP